MGVAEKESGLLNVTLGRTAGKIRGWGRLEGQAYLCVSEDREQQSSFMNHNRMDT